jgi:hypothetical protein
VFRFGLGIMSFDAVLYLYALVRIQKLEPLNVKLHVAAWFFVIGSAMSLIALVLVAFGYGWKRLGLAIACMVSLLFWYGFTLY